MKLRMCEGLAKSNRVMFETKTESEHRVKLMSVPRLIVPVRERELQVICSCSTLSASSWFRSVIQLSQSVSGPHTHPAQADSPTGTRRTSQLIPISTTSNSTERQETFAGVKEL